MTDLSAAISDSELARIHRVLSCYFPGEPASSRVVRLGEGNINDTYLVTPPARAPFVLQRINQAVFPEPHLVAENVHLVTAHLADRLRRETIHDLSFPTTVLALDGNCYVTGGSDDTWRALTYIPETTTHRHAPSPQQAYEGGRILGRFHLLLDDLDGSRLHPVLPGFHDLPDYARSYREAAVSHARGSTPRLEACCRAVESRLADTSLLEQKRDTGELAERVIHGDPKCDNILFADQGGRAVALIDLDTVSAGLLQYDLGDCLRSFCNTSGERAKSPEDVVFDLSLCRLLLTGYRDSGAVMTVTERDHVYTGVRLLTLELGIRFLTDYLEGDRYFKVTGEDDNLDRAYVQFRLLESIEQQREEIETIVTELW